jgi:hypothetical protein
MVNDPVGTAASHNPLLSTLTKAATAANLVDTLNSRSRSAAPRRHPPSTAPRCYAATSPQKRHRIRHRAGAVPACVLRRSTQYHCYPGAAREGSRPCWCVGATLDLSLTQYDHLRSAGASRLSGLWNAHAGGPRAASSPPRYENVEHG